MLIEVCQCLFNKLVSRVGKFRLRVQPCFLGHSVGLLLQRPGFLTLATHFAAGKCARRAGYKTNAKEKKKKTGKPCCHIKQNEMPLDDDHKVSEIIVRCRVII